MTFSRTTKRILSCEDSNKRSTTRKTEKKCEKRQSQTDPKKSSTLGNGKCISKSATQKKPAIKTCNNNAKQSSTSKKATKDKEKLPHVVKNL
jgi:hypothetical protein